MTTITTTRLFNAAWYLAHNPDVAENVAAGLITPEQHFELYGKNEGRTPGPLFDPVHYLAKNPDVAAAVINGSFSAYDHFVNFGIYEARSLSSIFDTAFYLAHNPDVAEAVQRGQINAVEHFLRFGQTEPRAVSPFIDLEAYVQANPDLKELVENGGSAFDHLVTFGIRENRDLGNGISLSVFSSDAKFHEALASGNIASAFTRINEVAPFLPSYQAPEGWKAPADTPIPLDFTPPEGTFLVIPASVEVPDDLELPVFIVPGQGSPEIRPEPQPTPVPAPEIPGSGPYPDPGPEPNPNGPEFYYLFAYYGENDGSLRIVGSNLESILAPDETIETDIKGRFDWGKINFGNQIYFSEGDIKSVRIEHDFMSYLKIVFSEEKAAEIRGEIVWFNYRPDVNLESGFIKDYQGRVFDIPNYSAYFLSRYELRVSDGDLFAPVVFPGSSLTIVGEDYVYYSYGSINGVVDAAEVYSTSVWIHADDGVIELVNLDNYGMELNYVSDTGVANIVASGAGLYKVVTGNGDDVIRSGYPFGTIFETGGGKDHISGGDDDDFFIFSGDNLTDDDFLDGGLGNNAIQINGGSFIQDYQFTNVNNISWLLLQGNAEHNITLGNEAGASFRGQVNVSTPSGTKLSGSVSLDMSASMAKLYSTFDVAPGGSVDIKGGGDSDTLYFSGYGDVFVRFLGSEGLKGSDFLRFSHKHQSINLDFSDFLGYGDKTPVLIDYGNSPEIDLSNKNSIGVVYNLTNGIYSDLWSLGGGKLKFEDNGKAVVLATSKSDPYFADTWSIYYVEDVDPRLGQQDWDVILVGSISSTDLYKNGFTANEIMEFNFL